MSLSFSTSWNAQRYDNSEDLLFEIGNLGFSELELSFNLTASILEGIKDSVTNKKFTVSSVHNYCPIPETFKRKEALPDCYSISSKDREERSLALKYTKRSIETASSLNAKAVVLHCGRVEVPSRARELINLYNAGELNSKYYDELKTKTLQDRSNSALPFVSNALKSLEELNKFAKDKGILLGIENRFYDNEIPSLEEIGLILERFKGSNIFYWHDTGHAQVMENLKIHKHADYLSQYGFNLLGIHLHNVIGCLDHQAPIKGQIDFNILKPYLKKDTIKVIEAHYPSSKDEIIESRKFLEKLFHDTI